VLADRGRVFLSLNHWRNPQVAHKIELFVGTLEKQRRQSGMLRSVYFCVPFALAATFDIIAKW